MASRNLAPFIAAAFSLSIASQAQADPMPQAVTDAIQARLTACWKPDLAAWQRVSPPLTVSVHLEYKPSGIPSRVTLTPRDQQRFREDPAFQPAALGALSAAATCHLTDLSLPQKFYPMWKSFDFMYDRTHYAAPAAAAPARSPESELGHGMGVMDQIH